jgi:hypothetical protein
MEKAMEIVERCPECGRGEWVGLTDDDELDWDGGDLKSLITAVEAKLKEKNDNTTN